jgi:3-oxoacyl-[acyl-carrier-protein] synthase-3
MKQAHIIGMGTWLPTTVKTNADWPAEFVEKTRSRDADRTFNDIPASSDELATEICREHLRKEANDPFLGAVLRHVSDPTTTASEAEAEAATMALIDAGLGAEQIDMVLAYAVVNDRPAPLAGPAACHLVGISQARIVYIDVVCASAVMQLEIARAFIGSGMARNVLCMQSHLMLRTVPKMHPASPGLGDAASAFIVSDAQRGFKARSLEVVGNYSFTHPEEFETVCFVRGHGKEADTPWHEAGSSFHPGSRAPERLKTLMSDTVKFGAQTLVEASIECDVNPHELDVIAAVQPRGFMPGAIAQRLGLPFEAAVTTYERVAHLGACGPVFNLVEARSRGLLTRGKTVGMYGQGAGFTRAGAILKVI